MNRKNNCIACRYQKDGVKTRKALVHTCGKGRFDLVTYPEVNIPKDYVVGVDPFHENGSIGVMSIWRKGENGEYKLVYPTNRRSEEFEKESALVAKLPQVDRSKKYFLGAELYDDRPSNLGAICVMSRNEDGHLLVEYSITTKPEEFEDEVERIAKYFNAVIWR